MSNEEAIKLLKGLANLEALREDLVEATNMAIKALEYQGCGCSLCLAHNNMICPKLKGSE